MSESKDPVDERVETLQEQIRDLRRELASARREKAAEPVTDYRLTDGSGAEVPLSALFGEKEDLVVIHNMGSRCPMCTLWADGLNGIHHHIEDRAAFVVSTPDAPEHQREFAESRGWTFRMLSTQGTTFALDLGFAGEHEGKLMPYPGLSVFRRTDDGAVVRVARDYFGPEDDYCVMWSLFGLLPDGQNDWWPKLDYDA